MLLQKEELEQKHVHLLQVVESEKTAKWQYTQQCEELSTEIKKLRNEVSMRTTMPARLFEARFIAQAIIYFHVKFSCSQWFCLPCIHSLLCSSLLRVLDF